MSQHKPRTDTAVIFTAFSRGTPPPETLEAAARLYFPDLTHESIIPDGQRSQARPLNADLAMGQYGELYGRIASFQSHLRTIHKLGPSHGPDTVNRIYHRLRTKHQVGFQLIDRTISGWLEGAKNPVEFPQTHEDAEFLMKFMREAYRPELGWAMEIHDIFRTVYPATWLNAVLPSLAPYTLGRDFVASYSFFRHGVISFTAQISPKSRRTNARARKRPQFQPYIDELLELSGAAMPSTWLRLLRRLSGWNLVTVEQMGLDWLV